MPRGKISLTIRGSNPWPRTPKHTYRPLGYGGRKLFFRFSKNVNIFTYFKSDLKHTSLKMKSHKYTINYILLCVLYFKGYESKIKRKMLQNPINNVFFIEQFGCFNVVFRMWWVAVAFHPFWSITDPLKTCAACSVSIVFPTDLKISRTAGIRCRNTPLDICREINFF